MKRQAFVGFFLLFLLALTYHSFPLTRHEGTGPPSPVAASFDFFFQWKPAKVLGLDYGDLSRRLTHLGFIHGWGLFGPNPNLRIFVWELHGISDSPREEALIYRSHQRDPATGRWILPLTEESWRVVHGWKLLHRRKFQNAYFRRLLRKHEEETGVKFQRGRVRLLRYCIPELAPRPGVECTDIDNPGSDSPMRYMREWHIEG